MTICRECWWMPFIESVQEELWGLPQQGNFFHFTLSFLLLWHKRPAYLYWPHDLFGLFSAFCLVVPSLTFSCQYSMFTVLTHMFKPSQPTISNFVSQFFNLHCPFHSLISIPVPPGYTLNRLQENLNILCSVTFISASCSIVCDTLFSLLTWPFSSSTSFCLYCFLCIVTTLPISLDGWMNSPLWPPLPYCSTYHPLIHSHISCFLVFLLNRIQNRWTIVCYLLIFSSFGFCLSLPTLPPTINTITIIYLSNSFTHDVVYLCVPASTLEGHPVLLFLLEICV